ncbi:MAG: McrC family protein [Fusobacteriaceae bacterium]
MKRITVYESIDYILLGEGENSLTLKEAHLLNNFIKKEKLKSNYIFWELDKFRFINYVGVITLAGVTIEILPKTKETDKIQSRKTLINMLTKSKAIDINYSELTNIDLKNDNLLEILAYLLSIKLKKELSRGIFREYTSIQDNLVTLKGKINIKNQIQNISRNKLKVACEYDEFTEDNLLNGLFKNISYKLIKTVKNLKTLDNLNFILVNFVDIREKDLNSYNLKKIKFHRNNQRFYESFILLKKILFDQSSMGDYGKDDGFCILFEINILYEKYIGLLCKSLDSTTLLQDKSKKLIIKQSTGNPAIQLNPDIYIPNKNIIIDTKWKLLKKQENRFGVQISDLYQMYAYLTRYKEVQRVILMYPLNDKDFTNGEALEKFLLEEDNSNKIELIPIDITSYENSQIGLNKILN